VLRQRQGWGWVETRSRESYVNWVWMAVKTIPSSLIASKYRYPLFFLRLAP
jgi:hypothetical protein